MNDSDGPSVTKKVYKALFEDGCMHPDSDVIPIALDIYFPARIAITNWLSKSFCQKMGDIHTYCRVMEEISDCLQVIDSTSVSSPFCFVYSFGRQDKNRRNTCKETEYFGLSRFYSVMSDELSPHFGQPNIIPQSLTSPEICMPRYLNYRI